MKLHLNRRRFLLGSASAAAALGLSGSYLWTQYPRRRAAWVEGVIRKHLPNAVLDEASLRTFARTTAQDTLLNSRARRFAVMAQQTAPWLTAQSSRVQGGLQKLERLVLTQYLLGSNFFRLQDPTRETVVYYGPALACGNPFARFA